MLQRQSWNPMTRQITMRQAMDSLFDDPWTQRVGTRRDMTWRQADPVAVLPLDIYSTENELVIKASIAGVAPDDVQITVEGDTLTIKGETTGQLENVDYHMQERRLGAFGRTLTFNVPVEAEEAEATFEHGELTLIIPKSEEMRPRVIPVKHRE